MWQELEQNILKSNQNLHKTNALPINTKKYFMNYLWLVCSRRISKICWNYKNPNKKKKTTNNKKTYSGLSEYSDT